MQYGANMKFEVTEVKALGKSLSRRLSLRLDKVDDPNQAQSIESAERETVYTIHAVVPFDPEFGPTMIGDIFEMKRAKSQLTK